MRMIQRVVRTISIDLRKVMNVLDEFEWRNGECKRPAVARVSIDVDIDDGKWKKTPCLKRFERRITREVMRIE